MSSNSSTCTYAALVAPKLPLQFACTVTIVSNIRQSQQKQQAENNTTTCDTDVCTKDDNNDTDEKKVDPIEQDIYPSSKRQWKVSYDYIQKRASAEIESGYLAGHTYVRRYDLKSEFRVRKVLDYTQLAESNNGGVGGGLLDSDNDGATYSLVCDRAYLGEKMPWPELPSTGEFKSIVKMDGEDVEHWEYTHEDMTLIRIYQTATEPKYPIRLEEVSLWGGSQTPLLTYTFSNFVVGPQDDSNFVLPSEKSISCARNVAGFPYLHAFHHYLRF